MIKSLILNTILLISACTSTPLAYGQFRLSERKKHSAKATKALSADEWKKAQSTTTTQINFILANPADTCQVGSNSTLYCTPEQEREQLTCSDQWVYLDEKLLIEQAYVNAADYYTVWDRRNPNPYGYNILRCKDTVDIRLTDNNSRWSMPLKDSIYINSPYGLRRRRWHHGIDLDLTVSDTVYAVFDGVVRIAKYNYRGYGYYVMIRHRNGLETLYGHLKKYLVKVGRLVKAGEPIGIGGNTGRSTGPHLHFETRYLGHAFNPVHIFDFQRKTIRDSVLIITRQTYKGIIAQSKKSYTTVRSGDSLWRISRRYRTTIGKLCRLNGISRNAILRIGRKIRVR